MIKTREQIEFLFSSKIKSGLELEYAKNNLLDIESEKKQEQLSVLISSMANAKGGTILFGIDAYRNRPKEFAGLNISVFTKDWFEYVLQNHISPKMDFASVEIIQIDNLSGKYVVAINIPDSSKVPFMALDRRYYKRVEGKTVLMEEYEVRDLYNKSKKSELDLFGIMNTGGVPVLERGKFEKVTFYPRFLIKNISNTIEPNYKLEFYLPSALQNANFDPLQQYFTRLEDEFSVFTVTGRNPLFQDELATILDAQLIVDRHSFKVFEEGEILLKLYYTNGVKSKSFKIRNTFLYKNKQLSYSDFASSENKLEFKFE